MRYAIVAEGSVVNIVEASEEFATGRGWIEAGENAVIGGTWGEVEGFGPAPIVAAPVTISDALALRKSELATLRHERQVAGYQHSDGKLYHSDAEGRGSVSQAVQLAEKYEAATQQEWATTSWKTQGTGFATHTLSSLIAVGLGLGAWIDGHFEREKGLIAEIDAAAEDETDPVAAVLAVDITTGWPGQE